MSGIDRITARIKSDVEAEAEAMLVEAKREAGDVIKRYEEDAGKQADELVRRGAAQADERLKRLEGVAELESGKNILTVKQEMLDLAFDRAAKAIAALPEEKYVEFLSKLAVQNSRTGKEQIVLSKNDRAKYGDRLLSSANASLAGEGKPATLTLSDEAADIDGGLLLKEEDVEVNCAIKTIVYFMRNKISVEVADVLFN
jgi:V/A-type H+-transporting ATPase subunit E